MENDKSPWNSFLQSGKITDYLDYCRDRNQEHREDAEETANADKNRWSGAVAPPDRGR